MNKLFYILTFLLIANLSFSQGLFNNGALIVIQTGAYVKVDGDANGNYKNTTSGTHGQIDIDGVMQVEGNWTNNASNDVFINNDGDGWVKLNGAAASTQTIGGSHATIFENLEVNHTTQGATCGITNNQVNGQLKLESGPLVLNSNIFIVNNTATTGIARNSGYIVSETLDGVPNTELSRLQWNIGTGTGNFEIPFGTVGGSYIPFRASISSAGTGSGNLTAATYSTSTANAPYPAYPNTVTTMSGGTPILADNSGNAVDRFWGITYNSYATNPTASLTFTYALAEINGQTAADLKAQYWDPSISPSAGWNSNLLGTGSAYQVTSVAGINVSRVWVLVNKNQPLPIELLQFAAQCDHDNVIASWATATETNNDYFTLEKSIDLNTWETVGLLPGAGTSNTLNTYNLTDFSPYPGFGYYRLKQTDFNGIQEVFSPVQVNCNDETENNFDIVTVYPDQSGNMNVTFTYPTDGENFTFAVYDSRGRLVQNQSKTTVAGFNQVSFSYKDYALGIYMISMSNSEKTISQKVLLK